MTKFELYEEWFKQQPFYVNMRYSRGDALFLRDGDVYRELPVQIGFTAMCTGLDALINNPGQSDPVEFFEKWYKSIFCEYLHKDQKSGQYKNIKVQRAWMGFKAALEMMQVKQG